MNEKKKEEGSQSFYRCKYKDNKIYEQVWKRYYPFTTPKRIQELLHCFNTLWNEGMNISVEKYVPKTKTNGITIPLKNRVMVCASIANLGAESY